MIKKSTILLKNYDLLRLHMLYSASHKYTYPSRIPSACSKQQESSCVLNEGETTPLYVARP